MTDYIFRSGNVKVCGYSIETKQNEGFMDANPPTISNSHGLKILTKLKCILYMIKDKEKSMIL